MGERSVPVDAGAPALGGDRANRTHVRTLAGEGVEGFTDGPGSTARFNKPWDVAVAAGGTVYVADHSNHRIRKITPDGTVSTLAGDGVAGHVDGEGHLARFNYPRGVAVDPVGNVYVADTDNDRIRKITPQGMVSTLSGIGTQGYVDGPRVMARFAYPNGVTVDGLGNVYVADAANRRIRKVSPGGTASTLAGDGYQGYADAAGREARFSSPRGIAVDDLGYVYVADLGNSRIRMVSPTGQVSTVAGDGRGVHADGVATAASFCDPCALAVDAAGILYVADSDNHCIRMIGPGGVVETVAGDGERVADFADGSGPEARFSCPRGIAVGPSGRIYVADTMNHCIRVITLG
ncbi:MAG: hypothetical protein JWM80_1195 [Cyanobacteria bacterium RYN_339]|nr:hypothetical protein [Cyanobacteria bacterium RYN_339]